MGINLNNQVGIIVGASSGMGAASAVLLAQKGMAVTLAARSGPSLASLEEQIRKTGGEASACQTDVTQRDDIEQMIQYTQQKYGRIDLLLYATGTNIPDRALPDLVPETWNMMIETNLSGAFHCTQLVLPRMRKQKQGLLIYLSTAAVGHADISGVSYQASKHGLSGLALGTAVEEKNNGIRTTIIFPGLTDTAILKRRPVPTAPEIIAKAMQPEDVAEAVTYVAQLHPRVALPELWLMPSQLP